MATSSSWTTVENIGWVRYKIAAGGPVKFIKPKAAEVFTITSGPAWPAIEFQTDASGAHVWTWSVAWGTFKASGSATTLDNRWDAKAAITNLGGTLTVTAQANQEKATVSVNVRGTNPTSIEARSTSPRSSIAQDSRRSCSMKPSSSTSVLTGNR
jgi:hypothetical protein